MLNEEAGELTQAFLMHAGQARDKGLSPAELDREFRVQLSDVSAQLLIMVRHFGLDVQASWRPAPWRSSARYPPTEPAAERRFPPLPGDPRDCRAGDWQVWTRQRNLRSSYCARSWSMSRG